MNPEEQLSAALHATLDARRPSPDLADRIVDRLATGPRRTSRFGLRFGLAAAAAIVLVAALVPLALNFRSNGPTTSASTSVLAHYHRGDLSFDAPASWGYEPSLGDRNGAILWSGNRWIDCTAATPTNVKCGPWPLDPGQVLVLLTKVQTADPLLTEPTETASLSPGESRVTVGGLPAVFRLGRPDSGLGVSLDWRLSVPGEVTGVSVQAEYTDPGGDQLRAQVEALVASIRYDDTPAVLDPADGPSRAAKGLAELQASDPTFACFPRVPGATSTATVATLPGPQLAEPLLVSCSFAVEPAPIGLWRVTLTESWTAVAHRTAGSVVTTLWLNPDGTRNAVTEDPRWVPLPGPSASSFGP
jgi:hypothetical protein